MIVAAASDRIAVAVGLSIVGESLVPIFLEALARGFAHALVALLTLGVLAEMLFVLALGDGGLLTVPFIEVVGAARVSLHDHDFRTNASALQDCADFIDSDILENSGHHAASCLSSPKMA